MSILVYSFITFIIISTANSVPLNQTEVVNINIREYNKKHLPFNEIIRLNNDIVQLNINVSNTAGFFIVQVHTFNKFVVLSETNPITADRSKNGTNIGLVKLVDTFDDIYTFYIFSRRNVTALIAVVAYSKEDPIPGGCNLTFKNKIAPYINIRNYKDYVSIEYQPASVDDHICEENSVRVDVYQYYASYWNFYEKTYFNGIQNMLTPDFIELYGTKITDAIHVPFTRRYFNYYVGAISVFAVIAKYGNNTSAYVPAVSTMCEFVSNQTCEYKLSLALKCIFPLLLLIGILLNFVGGYFSFVTQFVTASFCAFMLMYLLIGQASDIIGLSVGGIIGPVFGLLWAVLSLKCRLSIFSACVTHAAAGFTFASLLYNYYLGDNIIFKNDYTFWPIFMCIIIVTLLLFTPFTVIGNLISTCFVAAFLIIYVLSNYLEGFIHYSIISVVRRAFLRNYDKVILNPPISPIDTFLFVVGVVLIFFGIKTHFRFLPSNGYTSL